MTDDKNTFLNFSANIRLMTYDREILHVLPEHQVDENINRIPSQEKVKRAIHKMKSNKAAGPDGIPAENTNMAETLFRINFMC